MFHRQQGQISPKSGKVSPKGQQTTTQIGNEAHSVVQRAKADPSSLNAEEVLTLQETIGNRTANRLLAGRSATQVQAKLTIGQLGDKTEQGEERVAGKDVNPINAPVAQQFHQNLQRKELSDSLGSSIQTNEYMPAARDELRRSPEEKEGITPDGGEETLNEEISSIGLVEEERETDTGREEGTVVQEQLSKRRREEEDSEEGVNSPEQIEQRKLGPLDFSKYVTKQGKKKGQRRLLTDADLMKARRPTMYSFTTNTEGKGNTQGPHTVAHIYTKLNLGLNNQGGKALKPTSSIEDFRRVFKQLQPPLEVENVLDEVTTNISPENWTQELDDSCNRAMETYQELYRNVSEFIDQYEKEANDPDFNLADKATKSRIMMLARYIYEGIRRLIDQHPMATYKWVTKDATPEEMQTKGEGRETEFESYLDEGWILDPHIPTRGMEEFIKSLRPQFDMQEYLRTRETVEANKRLANYVQPS